MSTFARREFLTAGVAALSVGCGRKRGTGFDGYAFVANEEGHAVAAVDLSAFAVARHIKLKDAPGQVIAHPTKPFVYVLTPLSGNLHEIGTRELAVRRTLHVASSVTSMKLVSGALWILGGNARRLARVDLDSFRVDAHIALPAVGSEFDINERFNRAVVAYGNEGTISWIDLPGKKASAPQKLGAQLGAVRFLSNGESIVAANTAERLLTAVRARDGQVIAHLPLAVRPDHLCFNHDGGQLFITGEGRDAVVIVFPYFVPQVAETVLAGHAPGAMAATQKFLFVANPQAGDLSILNINRRRVVAVATVGAEPAHIEITPNEEYALVLNRRSGDMAVIRTAAIIPDRRKSAALFTMIPVGSKPVSAAVKAAG